VSGPQYTLVVLDDAQHYIDHLAKSDRYRIWDRLTDLRHQPRPAGCLKLTGSWQLWRIRAGNHRILYAIADDDRKVTVVAAGHRSTIYRIR
jgi:mRNA interferase RelE/StbE